ncbi:GNAT family N-acetyltransferase [Jannaschia seohaensis]|uniref:N-acetylglutamate synthase, GNAT family n=1 Tax=Jannaschia seohaensis TaxID=475081 RepID=A0A2Y9ANP5_9RHOB|nr:GNAT family N-acetyltransferase [Jannaschia seohaensis]PWJ19116.1 N-acetylglutamate synthase-like GNAT family acetyltransferase [Jannaschia seohaensis]SSA45755.1 N-acetylglutamate synthase, GNAT family [Jannaschia seohaensis]
MDDITFRDLAPGDPGWVLQRHGELYWQDEGYDQRFEALVARILADFIETRGPQERAWIAVDREGRRQGCVFCARDSETDARLRMFLVEPARRGTGLAQALLEAVIAHARATGASRLVLWTHESHRAAGRLYARSGFELLDETPVDAFGQSTIEQNWMLPL